MLAAVFGATVDTSTGATLYSTEDGRRLDLSHHLLHDSGVDIGADVTVISAFEHEMRAQDSAASPPDRHPDQEARRRRGGQEARGSGGGPRVTFPHPRLLNTGGLGPSCIQHSSWFSAKLAPNSKRLKHEPLQRV